MSIPLGSKPAWVSEIETIKKLLANEFHTVDVPYWNSAKTRSGAIAVIVANGTILTEKGKATYTGDAKLFPPAEPEDFYGSAVDVWEEETAEWHSEDLEKILDFIEESGI